MRTGIFIVNRDWQKVELEGAEIENGVFTVVSLTDDDIGFIISDTQPSQQVNGDVYLRTIDSFSKYELFLNERLWAKSKGNASNISVVQA